MNVIRGIVKTVVVAKVIEIAGRELSKPENQRKIKDAVNSVVRATRKRA